MTPTTAPLPSSSPSPFVSSYVGTCFHAQITLQRPQRSTSAMFGVTSKKEGKHDDGMTVWVPKGVYNSVQPLWDARYAWHPIPVDDSMPMDQTSFIQVDDTNINNSQDLDPAAATTSHGSLTVAPQTGLSQDTASVHSAVSALSDLPPSTITASAGPRPSPSAPGQQPPRKSDFGFPVRQMTWNTSRRKRDALLQRQKSRDKYGVPSKTSLAPAPPALPAPAPAKATPAAPREGRVSSCETPPFSTAAPEALGREFVMFAL